MKKFLILAFACITAWSLHAQVPQKIVVPKQTNPNAVTPDVPCNNYAGTFTLGASGVNTQSNDLTPDTLYLCHNDSIFIDHNGDYNLSGDPNSATPPGVGYAFYRCPPSATGPTLQNIIGSGLPPIQPDPCILVDPADPTDLLVASGTPEGDMWFFNSGYLQTTFNMGDPILIHFAPITIDAIATNSYETTVAGGPPGTCVNVNINEEIAVVYLNPVSITGFQSPFGGNTCQGRFKLEGGYPEYSRTFDPDALYTVNIYLQSDPTVKAIINNPANQLKYGVSLIFSAPQAGVYVVEVEDGKSCGLSTTVNVLSCTNSDNVNFVLPDETATPGEIICVPITTSNYTNIQGFSTSIQWDPTILQLQPGTFIQNVNGDLVGFDPATNTETGLAGDGYLGIAHIGDAPGTLAANETLMEVCFVVVTAEDSVCTAINFINNPSSVSVVDGNGATLAFEGVSGEICIYYDTLSVNVDTLLSPCNSSTVSYTLTIKGEEAPYEVVWTLAAGGPVYIADNIPAGVPYTLADLAPGNYRIIVTPLNGADITNADTFFLNVILPASLGASLDLSQLPTCNGQNDGEVSVQVYQGTTPVSDLTGYLFNWTAFGGGMITAPGQPVQSGVRAGNYAVTVTQPGTGCTAIASGTLPNPTPMSNGMVNITPATCTGIDNGTLSYEMSGGIPITGGLYNFKIYFEDDCNNPNPNPPLIDDAIGNPYANPNLLPGCYRVDVTDANGCTYTDHIEVPALRTLTLSQQTATQPLCFGGADGSLTAQVVSTPALPLGSPYFFSWIPVNGAVNGTITNPTATSSTNLNIGAGTFLVSVLDQDGCIDTLTLSLGQPTQLNATFVTEQDPTCVAPTSGQLGVLAIGGTGFPNYTYSWSTGAVTSGISGLSEGDYSVTVRDANGCADTLTSTLALPAPPDIQGITSVALRCGNDGSLTVVAPAAVTYSWSSLDGNIINDPTNAAITDLAGGTYVVEVRDANSCVNRDTATLVNVVPLFFSDTTLTDPTCYGYSNGGIAIGVSGGTPAYNYTWSVPQAPNSPVVPALLPSGVYTVTVRDIQNCELIGQFILNDPDSIQYLVTNVTDVSCFGVCDGDATIIINNVNNINYIFSWEDGGSTDSLRNDLCVGTSRVTITEQSAAQCFTVATVITDGPAPVSATSTITNTTCFGDDDGAVALVPTGGNGAPYTYLWQQGGTTASLSNLPAGTYVVTITDANQCTGQYSVVVGEPAPIQINADNINSQPITCFGEDDGSIAVTVTGGNTAPLGTPQYSYLWSDGTNQLGNTNPLSMLASGDYSVTVSDYKNCTGTANITLFDPPAVQGTYELGEPLKCFGDETTLTITNISGGAGEPYTYTVDFGVPLPSSFTSSISGGDHELTFLDKKGCENTITINVPEPAEIKVAFNPAQIELQLGDSMVLNPTITGIVAVDSFVWMPAEFLRSTDTLNPVLYTFESGIVMLTVYDANGCSGKGSLEVTIDPNRNVYLPNAFNPGNDRGENDYFTPYIGVGVELVNYMRVFDRWGELMYERERFLPNSLELTSGWDGRYKGKYVEPGVYMYAVEVKFLDGKVLLYRGDITVVR